VERRREGKKAVKPRVESLATDFCPPSSKAEMHVIGRSIRPGTTLDATGWMDASEVRGRVRNGKEEKEVGVYRHVKSINEWNSIVVVEE
jgi:hypothetical protein